MKTMSLILIEKHLILLGQYNGNYYVQDVASLDAFGGVLS